MKIVRLSVNQKKNTRKTEKSLIKILNMIKGIQDPSEKSNRLQQLLNEIGSETINIEKVSHDNIFIEILNIINCNDIDTLAKLTNCFELNTLKIKAITNKLNTYIKNNKKKEKGIYKKDLVEKIQTKMINFLGSKKCNNFALWNSIFGNQNINNPEIMINFCDKFNNNMIKAKKRDKIIFPTSCCLTLLVSAIPLVNFIAFFSVFIPGFLQ